MSPGWAGVILATTMGLQPGAALGQGTAFTYQGRLDVGAAPASGTYDLQFGLYSSSTGPTLLTAPVNVPSTVISNGVFAVTLDFGSGWFDGSPRWLEISARTNGGANYTTLAPRQAFTAMPYAIEAGNAAVAEAVPVGAISGAMLADGAVTSAKLAPGAVYQLSAPGGMPTNAVQVTSGGQVGIGTNNTGAALQITGGALFTNPAGATFIGAVTNHSAGITNLGAAVRMFVSQNRGYVTSFSPGSLEIFNLANPAKPVLWGEAVDASGRPGSPFTHLFGADGIFVTNGIAYVGAEEANAVTIMDVSNPQNPVLLSTITRGTGSVQGLDLPTDLLVSGTNLFVLGFLSASLSVFDVHDPAHPVLVKEVFDTNRLNYAYGMCLAGTRLFIAARQANGVAIYDIANPANPQLLGQIVDRGMDPNSPFTRLTNANWVDVVGNTAYIASGPWSGFASSLTIADVSNPGAPAKLAEIADASVVPGSPFGLLKAAWAVKVVGTTAFVSAVGGGLTAIDVSDPRNPRLLAQWANGTNGLTTFGAFEGLAVAGNTLYALEINVGAIDTFQLSSQLGLNVAGYVGIGTAAPRTALDVAGVISAQGLDVNGPVQSDQAGTFGALFVQGSVTVDAANLNGGAPEPGLVFGGSRTEAIASTRTPGGNQGGLDFYTAGASRMSITSAGNVGIGTNAPSNPLWVQGNGPSGAGTIAAVQTSGSAYAAAAYGLCLVPGGNGLYGQSDLVSTNVSGPAAGNIGVYGTTTATNGSGVAGYAFASSGITYGVIGSASSENGYGGYFLGRSYFSGLVGVGTTTPQTALHVMSGGGDCEISLQSGSPGGRRWTAQSSSPAGSGELAASFQIIDRTLGVCRLLIATNGNVGIGTTAPTSALQVAGTVTATSFNPSSDRNLKENFRLVDPVQVLDKVAALPLSRWNFKGDTATEHLGPMAQDFHTAFGLNGADDTHIATVDEGGVALAAIQGLDRKTAESARQAELRIQSLEAENAELKQRLAALEATVTKLAR